MANVSASVGAVMKPAGFENAQGVLSAHYAKDAGDAQWKDDPGHEEVARVPGQVHPDADRSDSQVSMAMARPRPWRRSSKMCGDDLTRANIMKQAANLKDFTPDTLLPGVKINTSATDFAPIEQLQMMRFKGEKWEMFGDIISGEAAIINIPPRGQLSAASD